MEYAAGPPSQWLLTLKDGSTIEVWADSYCEEQDQFQFESLVEASHEEQRHVKVTATGRQPTSKVLILVARIPAVLVSSIEGGPVEIDGRAGPVDTSD
ncbi:hypothetical protein KDK95_34155 [Actinospica sp. MGRD01-02]|uniref:Uncharacterized protein n=1 Tax=Actinospica acidithermotolerans TaxID=2828514 RepID=A0A941EIF7_9ACTN|nr:hypothetical protein [Actinospica acidithermotolerans]MBR7831398.1 hypothetical protein [Actinospica acidithermotolerans]